MKKLLFLSPLLLVLSLARAQTITNTSAVPHTTGTPSGAPTTYGSWLRYDKTNKILYQWTGAAWTRVVGAVADGDKGDITVSSGGTNWQLDAGSVGNAELATGVGGIYKGSGTIANSCVATIDNQFIIASAGNPRITALESGGYLNSEVGVNAATIGASDVGASMFLSSIGEFKLTSSGIAMEDLRATPRGIEYSADYSATYTSRSLVDKAYVTTANATNANLTGPVTSVGNATAITANAIDSSHIANGTISPNDFAQRGASVGQVMTYTANGWRAATAGGAASYLVYTALLTQSGTSAPVATVLENTLGGTVVWTRGGVGAYTATLTGVLVEGKTWWSPGFECGSGLGGFALSITKPSGNNDIQISTGDVGGTPSDDILTAIPIEIRVYP